MTNRIADLSIGVAAAVGPALARDLAPRVEAAGFHALWVNDTPGNDALEVLAAAAAVTERLVLATGVLPVDRRGAEEIATTVRERGLPEHRLVLGIGSGGLRQGALDAVRGAVERLRELTNARIAVGALGPRMRRLGAEAADGLVLSWLTPEVAAPQTREAHAIAPEARGVLYARTALDEEGVPGMLREADRYAGFPAYSAHFARLGIGARDTVIAPDDAPERIAAYRAAVDELVLRVCVADQTPRGYAAFVDAAAHAVDGSAIAG